MAWTEIIWSRSGAASMLSGLMEGLGIPWPGAVVLAAGGTEALDFSSTVALALCFGVVYTGAAWVQYVVGRYFWHLLVRFVPKGQQAKLRSVMRRHGEFAVLWTRPLAIGNYVSLPAGMIRMHQGKFLAYTFLGIMPWCLAMTFGGNYLAAHLEAAGLYLTATAVILAVIGGARAIQKAARARRADRPTTDEEEASTFAD